jgi:hypothetical protein
MTPADRRITELIDKWLASIQLHLQYVELSDAAYARAQPWPRHDRPTRWVLEVARQKILELKGHCENRQAMGDSKFAESLELMAFLANLVGVQHVQRFVPLADPARENSGPSTLMEEAPTQEAPALTMVPRLPLGGDETTREMPRLKPASGRQANSPDDTVAQPMPTGPRVVPIVGKPGSRASSDAPKLAAVAPRPIPPSSRPAQGAMPKVTTQAAPRTAATPMRSVPRVANEAAPTVTRSASTELKGKIIGDAVRLLKWGKQWHELADLIARIADRPTVPEVRKILRAYKSEIEAKVGRSS